MSTDGEAGSVGAFFFPNGDDQNSFTSGPGKLKREPAMVLVG